MSALKIELFVKCLAFVVVVVEFASAIIFTSRKQIQDIRLYMYIFSNIRHFSHMIVSSSFSSTYLSLLCFAVVVIHIDIRRSKKTP